MDKKALECLINDSRKDSLIFNMSVQIINFKKILNVCGEKSYEYERAYSDEKKLSEKLRKDLEKSKNWNKKILIGGPVIGLLVGIIITKK